MRIFPSLQGVFIRNPRAASDSDIVDMNSSASDDTDAETYDESYDTDNSDAE